MMCGSEQIRSEEHAKQLENFRPYLLLLARQQLQRKLQSKVDVSGVVNLTLFEACRDYPKVQNRDEAQKLRWLRKILLRNLIDYTRTFRGAKRNIEQEISLEADIEESSRRLVQRLAGDTKTPSQHAARKEDILLLAQALLELPGEQRQAVEMHHLQGYSLEKTAAELSKTKAAVAGLMYRGLNRLREALAGNI